MELRSVARSGMVYCRQEELGQEAELADGYRQSRLLARVLIQRGVIPKWLSLSSLQLPVMRTFDRQAAVHRIQVAPLAL